ncbi:MULTISPECIES: hypothetical protein [Vibrio]|uniref:Uncharacterized protein n=1 Tax=Vibrio coralliirubri TaxID=1516159 RepID=A0AA86WPW8_9VIBR|nr:MULTISPECIES: hypothetical protein [Vibrio]CAH7333410.1 conserved hypothetical protein [Vibrio chagasii]MDH5939743.1 hypothetical protein [Vibrio splendidus]MDP2590206.1 hypothetical protein [Vibrio splendidus]TCN98681.1 hypothetical protein EDB50_101460 [Vibrio crassostreae]TCT53029.1 hypothetical protein EDB39_10191 [Vibrio crassostreae]
MTTPLLRNSQEEFIHKKIHQILLGEGYEHHEANHACNFAIETYRTTASFGGRGGKCFDFCLAKARQLLAPMKKTANARKRKAEK